MGFYDLREVQGLRLLGLQRLGFLGTAFRVEATTTTAHAVSIVSARAALLAPGEAETAMFCEKPRQSKERLSLVA